MTKTQHNQPLLITGTNGRLGGFMRAALAGRSGLHLSARRAPADLILGGSGPLPDLPACDTVIALWGQTSNDPTFAAQNSALAHRSRAVARACGARRVLHLSSAAIYGPGTQMTEAHPAIPSTVYGTSKWEMEQQVAGFSGDHARHLCLRLANVVGADSLAPALGADTPVKLHRFKDRHGPRRSYIAPGDLARVLEALSALDPADLPQVLNVAAPEPVSMEALARAAGRAIDWEEAPGAALQDVTMNTARLQTLLPALPLLRSADEMIADWQSLRGAQ